MNLLQKYHATFAIALLVVSSIFSCQPYNRYRHPYYAPYFAEKMILTEKTIREYSLGENDLAELAYFLDKRLIIRDQEYDRSRRVTTYGSLNLQDTRFSREIEFPMKSRGYAVTVWKERTFPYFTETIKIGIAFDNTSMQYLIFSPDFRGRYRLETSFLNQKLKYGGREYDCINGCGDNFLLISGSVNQRLGRVRKVVGQPYYRH